jgi:Dynamin family
MLATEQLNQFKNYAQEILQKLQEYRYAISQEHSTEGTKVPDNLSTCIDNIEKAAKKVVNQASSSVKIGVMGEFSSGKTTLLGSLLGYAGALPESEKASTGNVTYLSIEQETTLKPTQFQFKVEYLDQNEAEDCLDFMLKMAKESKFIEQLDNKQRTTLENLNPKNTEVWQQVVDWYKDANSKIDNPELRNQIKEIQEFAQSYIWYGANVCRISKPIDLDIDTVPFALQLHDQMMDQKIDFDHIPTDKDELIKLLQASFFLIRRINVEVKVSNAIWDLSSIQGANKLVLLDFPGLENAKSAVRDRFLSKREMNNVQTILILIEGRRLGSAGTLKIFNILQKERPNQVLDDFILVGVSRFDEMNLGEDITNESLTQQISLSQLQVLHRAVENIRQDYTKQSDEGIILLSAFMALDTMNRSKEVPVGSDKILTKLNNPDFKQKSEELRQKWKQLSQRLKESDLIVAGLLEKAAEDGGINHLRILLENHVNSHGLKQLSKDVRSQVEKLHNQQTELRKMLNQPSLQEKLLAYKSSPLHNLYGVLQKLTDNYSALKTHLTTSPLELGVGIDEKRMGIPLTKVIEDEVNFNIFSWSEWRYLIDNLNNGKINIPESEDITQAQEDFLKLLEEGLNNPDESQDYAVSKPPTTSDDFYNTFEHTVKKLEKDTREKIGKAIEDFLNKLSNNRVSLQGDHTTIDLASLRDQLISCLPSSQIDNRILRSATNPMEWKETINGSIKDKKLRAITPQYIFPLACEEKDKNKPGQKFIWNPEISNTNISQENHQIIMLQLRDAMIASVSQQLAELVREANKQVNEYLTTVVLSGIISTLEKLSKNQADLKKIAYGESQPDSSTPDWLESLNKLTSIKSPL